VRSVEDREAICGSLPAMIPVSTSGMLVCGAVWRRPVERGRRAEQVALVMAARSTRTGVRGPLADGPPHRRAGQRTQIGQDQRACTPSAIAEDPVTSVAIAQQPRASRSLAGRARARCGVHGLTGMSLMVNPRSSSPA